jgi:pyruvate,water dikinase
MKRMFVKFFEEIIEPKISEFGGKGYSLVMLFKNGFNVPNGFIINSQAFFEFLKANNLIEKIKELSSNINEQNFKENSFKIRNLILNERIPEEIASEVKDALNKLNVNYVSVRSSGISEDSLKASFAGLFDTFLNVKSEPISVLENVKKCWASSFNERAVIYRLAKRLPQFEGMAVIVQEMIPAEVSGITFTVSPENKDALLIELSLGTGENIVGGKVIPDRFVIHKKTLNILKKEVAERKSIISNITLKKIAKICLNIENIFGYPQDIEWCISKGIIYLLQSRPITIFPHQSIKEKVEGEVILKGIGASPGVVRGKVKIILTPMEIWKLNEGEILVTTMTNPMYLSAIKKAKAIITDIGGMICHAAIVSRELGIPCVTATGNATKVLKDGMEVIVDGTKGFIYVI